MKLASLKAGRDGRLVVVSHDLTQYADASHIAPTLQSALDNWKRAEPRLQANGPAPFSMNGCAPTVRRTLPPCRTGRLSRTDSIPFWRREGLNRKAA